MAFTEGICKSILGKYGMSRTTKGLRMKTTTICAQKCSCGADMYIDRYVDGKKACPGCDPELGISKEMRLENYKKLISMPMPNIFKKVFKD